MIKTSEPTFMLPSPCQGSGSSPFVGTSPFFQLPSTSSDCCTVETKHKMFNWRPALENVLLEALELSVVDALSHQQRQEQLQTPQQQMNFGQPYQNDREENKDALRSSQLLQFQTLVSGNAMKRQRVNIDDNEFQAHPVMSLLKQSEQGIMRLTPRYRKTEPLPRSGNKARRA